MSAKESEEFLGVFLFWGDLLFWGLPDFLDYAKSKGQKWGPIPS